jgi:hypothetical protein
MATPLTPCIETMIRDAAMLGSSSFSHLFFNNFKRFYNFLVTQYSFHTAKQGADLGKGLVLLGSNACQVVKDEIHDLRLSNQVDKSAIFIDNGNPEHGKRA